MAVWEKYTILMTTFINIFFINNYNNYNFISYYYFYYKSKKLRRASHINLLLRSLYRKNFVFQIQKCCYSLPFLPQNPKTKWLVIHFCSLAKMKRIWRHYFYGPRAIHARSGNDINQLWQHFSNIARAADLLQVKYLPSKMQKCLKIVVNIFGCYRIWLYL
jgi:hypothetical protein